MQAGFPRLFYYFESNDIIGAGEKYELDMIRQWYGNTYASKGNIKPILIILYTNYAKDLAQVILDAGVPFVAAVNKITHSGSDDDLEFIKMFCSFLIQGDYIETAFDKAKIIYCLKNPKIGLCCCSHSHKENCVWAEKLINEREVTHAKHISNCSCPIDGNVHSKDCSWVKNMIECSCEVKTVEEKIKLCCCDPDLPHNIDNKIFLLSRANANKNTKIFEKVEEGEPIIDKHFIDKLVPQLKEQVIGKRVELQKLVSLLISQKNEHSIISLTGPRGVGKVLLSNAASKYAIERGYFKDGIATFNLETTTWLENLLNELLLVQGEKEAKDFAQLKQRLKDKDKLVILECSDSMKGDLVSSLNKLLEDGCKIKFLIIAEKKQNDIFTEEMVLEEKMDLHEAYRMIKKYNEDWKCNSEDFENHTLATILVSPWIVKKASFLLKNNSLDEVYTKLCKEGLDKHVIGGDLNEEWDIKSLENLFGELSKVCKFIEPLYMLAQIPGSLLKSDCQLIWGSNFEQWKEQAKDYISATSHSQTIVFALEAEDIEYKITDIAKKYVNKFLLNSAERFKIQLFCIQEMAKLSRIIVTSFNYNKYKYLPHNEFSAVVNQGIWKSQEISYNSKKLSDDGTLRFRIQKANFLFFLDPRILETIIESIQTEQELCKVIKHLDELAICTITMLVHLGRPIEAVSVACTVQEFASNLSRKAVKSAKNLFDEIQGKMKLLIASQKIKQFDGENITEAWDLAEQAENIFKITEIKMELQNLNF